MSPTHSALLLLPLGPACVQSDEGLNAETIELVSTFNCLLHLCINSSLTCRIITENNAIPETATEALQSRKQLW